MEISIDVLELVLKFTSVIVIPVIILLMKRFKTIETKQAEIEKKQIKLEARLANKLTATEASELIAHELAPLHSSVSKMHETLQSIVLMLMKDNRKSPPS